MTIMYDLFSFLDSKIARQFSCGRSKSTVVIKTLAEHVRDDLVGKMKKNPFSIATDGSNDQRNKQYPIVVTNVGSHGVETSLLCVSILKDDSTGEVISMRVGLLLVMFSHYCLLLENFFVMQLFYRCEHCHSGES